MFKAEADLIATIPSSTELLKMVVELTRHVVGILEFPDKEVQQIALAVDEAITNVIKHSYRYEKGRDIRIEFFTAQAGLKIRIIYAGIAPELDPATVSVERLIKQKRKGGLGVQLMRKIMDSVEYSTSNGLNICEMIKWKKRETVG
ncbi:MAG TPA: ATP-binding protein [Candidatus Aminicenantes bacterium]|nr:ATP-binding protein [Candidatus Aminicenantes bacterium]